MTTWEGLDWAVLPLNKEGRGSPDLMLDDLLESTGPLLPSGAAELLCDGPFHRSFTPTLLASPQSGYGQPLVDPPSKEVDPSPHPRENGEGVRVVVGGFAQNRCVELDVCSDAEVLDHLMHLARDSSVACRAAAETSHSRRSASPRQQRQAISLRAARRNAALISMAQAPEARKRCRERAARALLGGTSKAGITFKPNESKELPYRVRLGSSANRCSVGRRATLEEAVVLKREHYLLCPKAYCMALRQADIEMMLNTAQEAQRVSALMSTEAHAVSSLVEADPRRFAQVDCSTPCSGLRSAAEGIANALCLPVATLEVMGTAGTLQSSAGLSSEVAASQRGRLSVGRSPSPGRTALRRWGGGSSAVCLVLEGRAPVNCDVCGEGLMRWLCSGGPRTCDMVACTRSGEGCPGWWPLECACKVAGDGKS